MQYPEPIAKLIDSYLKLPGIGEKTATRLAFFTIDMEQSEVVAFSKALVAAKKDLSYCSICGNITENDPCVICADKTRGQRCDGFGKNARISWLIPCFTWCFVADRR